MSAIVTDQLRILNSKNFISGINSTSNSYYLFVGLPNSQDYSSNWNISPLSPNDNFDDENSYWDSMIAMKKIKPSDVSRVIRKITWTSGTVYDMYRHDIDKDNLSKPSNKSSLYLSNYYVMNSNFQVYICLYNGITPENPSGRSSLVEPTFTDLEPKSTGSSDGYIWKYLYTIKPSDAIKFISTDYMPVPNNWESSAENSAIRSNATISGQIKVITIKNRGSGMGPPNSTYTNVPIRGDGIGATATIVINNDSRVDSITVSDGGSGYTYGTVDLSGGNVPLGTTSPVFDIIIPPKGGHGFDIYRELGAYLTMVYSRLENDANNPDFTTGNTIARIGIVENPQQYNSSSLLINDKVSAVGALKLVGPSGNRNLYSSVSFSSNSIISQTIGTGVTASAKVISYDQSTGVLKYWKDRTLVGFNTNGTRNTTPIYGYQQNDFTSSPTGTGNLTISGGTQNLFIDVNFGTQLNPGISTTINNKTYNLGQSFVSGISNPEVKKYSGNVIYVDNRPAITRSQNQKEDIKVILQF